MALISEGVAKLLKREGQLRTVVAARPNIRVVKSTSSTSRRTGTTTTASTTQPLSEVESKEEKPETPTDLSLWARATQWFTGQTPQQVKARFTNFPTGIAALEKTSEFFRSPIMAGVNPVLSGGLYGTQVPATTISKASFTPAEEDIYREVTGLGEDESIFKGVRDVSNIKESVSERIENIKERISDKSSTFFQETIKEGGSDWWDRNKKYVLYGALGLVGLWLAGKYVSKR